MTQISNRMRVTTLAVLCAFCSMMMATTGAMAAPTTKPASPASTYVQGADALGNVLNGVFTIQNFASSGNQLVAQGVLNGTITSATGTVTNVTNQSVTLPVSGVSATCQILNLVLGPLDLNLLGLTIHLNQVVLNITAVSGNGNLLGNLLCAVANLLNGSNLSSILNTLVTDLNLILAAL
ncbi:MAG TPA: hypothetical protein VFO46_25645 [Candidatus Sulfotelmatobacter sp.]|nr:hypothetical protein [Candidatus Sulfotelmatobacter sp.]